MSRKLLKTRGLCTSAVIAALYAALTALLAPISYGNVQCRLAEAMTLLPMMTKHAIPGLFVGCLIANLFSPMVTVQDIVFGSLATLFSAMLTYRFRRRPLLAAACPVLVNAVMVGGMLSATLRLPFALTAGEVALGEGIAVAAGFLLLAALRRTGMDLMK